MIWNDFYKAVAAGNYQNIYTFTGPEELNKREALAALRKSLLPPGLEELNDATLEGVSAQAIIDCAETMPVMCEKRIVVVRDWAPLLAGKAKNEEADVSRFMEWMKDMPDSCIVVFYMMQEMDARKKLSALLKKQEGYVEFGYLSGSVLQKWCNQRLKSIKKRISVDAVEELTLRAGQDLTRLSGELDKLSAYIDERTEISVQDVQALVAPSPEYSVFIILNHLLEDRLADAVDVVNTVLTGATNAVRIIAMFESQLRINAHMKYAQEDGGNVLEAQKMLGVTEYRAKHILRQIRPFSADLLKAAYLECVQTDQAIKSGKLQDRAALDMLMLKISKISSKNSATNGRIPASKY